MAVAADAGMAAGSAKAAATAARPNRRREIGVIKTLFGWTCDRFRPARGNAGSAGRAPPIRGLALKNPLCVQRPSQFYEAFVTRRVGLTGRGAETLAFPPLFAPAPSGVPKDLSVSQEGSGTIP
jgi:hypothetical protein